MLSSLLISMCSACLLLAVMAVLLLISRKLLHTLQQASTQVQLLGQAYREKTELEQRNLVWKQDQLILQERALSVLQEQLKLIQQSTIQAAQPLLSAALEKIERQRYTLRIRNEGLGPALAINYNIKDKNLRTFETGPNLDREFLGPGATGLLQVNMLGLPLPNEFLVLHYKSMTGEEYETHLSWKKGILRSDYRISNKREAIAVDSIPLRENPPAEQELAG